MSILPSFERFAVTFNEGDIIFCEYEPGDSFFLIQSGSVRIVKIFGDIEKTIDILYPGEFFGEMSILENAPRSATIVAQEPCKLLEFNKSNFETLMTGNPQIALKLLKLFVKRIHDQKRRFQILTLPDIESRVAEVFIMLSENQEIEEEDYGKRIFYDTMDDIAHWAGLSVSKCREVLHRYSDQGRIEIFKDRIIVKNINELKRLVSSKKKS